MKAALFLVALISASFALSSEETVDIINKIDATAFGHTLFETIFVSMEAGDPLDRLLETLGSLEDGLIADQKEDDGVNRDFQDACNRDIAQLQKEINEANVYSISLEGKLEGALYPQRSILQGIVNSKTKEVADINKQINELDANRSEEKAEFE